MNYKVSVEDILNRTEHMVLLDNQKEFREQVASFLSMHCLRVRCLNSGFDSSELPRVSMIAIASSGSGKTYVTSRLAEAAGIKVITVDCSSLTRTGWKGVNLGRLIDMEYRNIKDSEAFETCVIHFDEVDKLRYSGDAYSDCNNPQPDFLKIFDGEIHCESDSGGTKKYNTTRMSFLFSGAFSGLENIIRKRLSPGRAIGFSATTDTVDTTNILSMVTTEDLYKYGFMKELLGRIGQITHIPKLTESDYKTLIMAGDGSICNRYNNILKSAGVTVEVSEEACSHLASECCNSDIGARAAVPTFQKYILGKIRDIEECHGINKIQLDFSYDRGYFVNEFYGERTHPKPRSKQLLRKNKSNRPHDVSFAETLKRENGVRAAVNEMMRVYTWTELDEYDLEFDRVRCFLNCVMLYFKHHCREEDQTLSNVLKFAKTTTLNENGTSTFLTILDKGVRRMMLCAPRDRIYLQRMRDRFAKLCSNNFLTGLVRRHIEQICNQWYLELHDDLIMQTGTDS